MSTYRLVRHKQTAHATFGRLFDPAGVEVAVTLELPWRNNAHNASCIPAGSYPCHRRISPKRKYEVMQLGHVPDRGAIQIHIGNIPADTDGCILLGTQFAVVHGEPGISESRVAFSAFMRSAPATMFTLDVVDEFPQPEVPHAEADAVTDE